MRSASLFSIFGLALSMSAAIVACSGDDDDKGTSSGTPSAQGESCARTADCASGLVCLGDVCEKKGGSSTGGGAGEGTGGSTGGTKASGGTGGSTGGKPAVGGSAGKAGSAGSGTVVVPPVLGGEGESCTRAADCETGLHCFNQRCVAVENNGSGGEAGGNSNPPPSVRLGEQGETCSLSSDCADGLACLPTSVGAGTIGVCSVTTTGIQPTGMDCHAECLAPSDCCELPPSILVQFDIGSCTDLSNILDGVDCTDPGASAPECFVYATYCQCGSKTWACTDGLCEYKTACTDPGLTTGGCATKSRSDITLVSTCTDGKCEAPAVTPVCAKDADCLNKAVKDVPADTCTDGECVCYKPEGNCYRKCGNDLDCATGKVCNAKTSLCEPAPECTDGNDLPCQTKNHNIKSSCVNSACVDTCATDLDCNSLTGSLTRVCGSDHTCQVIGCSSNEDCTGSAVHMFCTDVVAGSGGTVVSSAITGGT